MVFCSSHPVRLAPQGATRPSKVGVEVPGEVLRNRLTLLASHTQGLRRWYIRPLRGWSSASTACSSRPLLLLGAQQARHVLVVVRHPSLPGEITRSPIPSRTPVKRYGSGGMGAAQPDPVEM